jgi:hypothetical protein
MAMSRTRWASLVGGVFLGIALYRFLSGEAWVVWLILGVLLGGLGLLGRSKEGADPS